MPMQTRIAAALLAGVSALAVPAAQAQDKNADDWRFRAALYGYFPRLDGTTSFPTGSAGPNINVDAGTLVSSLKFAFMGTFEAQKGKWGALADVFYSNVGGSDSATRDFSLGARAIPADLTANLNLDVKTTIFTLVGTYSLVESPDYSLAALAGVRVATLDQTLNWTFAGNIGAAGLPGRSGTTDVSATNWDAVVGVRGRARFGEQGRWYVPYYLDLGTGNSQFTWQAVLGVGYAFHWGDVFAAWRYIDYDLKSGTPIQSLSFNGPAIGVAFSW